MSSTLERTALFVIGLVVLISARASAIAVDVPKWSTYDIELTSGSSYANGYAAGPASFSATFTGPGGVTQKVRGFWDGGKKYTIRFTPTVEGTWSYATSSSDATLNGQTGTINATPALPGRHGFSANRPQLHQQLRLGRRHALLHGGANLLRLAAGR